MPSSKALKSQLLMFSCQEGRLCWYFLDVNVSKCEAGQCTKSSLVLRKLSLEEMSIVTTQHMTYNCFRPGIIFSSFLSADKCNKALCIITVFILFPPFLSHQKALYKSDGSLKLKLRGHERPGSPTDSQGCWEANTAASANVPCSFTTRRFII